jgi:hypothetical protein
MPFGGMVFWWRGPVVLSPLGSLHISREIESGRGIYNLTGTSYQREISRLEFVEDLVLHVGVLPEGRLEVPHLPLDRLGELEDAARQQRPVLSQHYLEERASDPAEEKKIKI